MKKLHRVHAIQLNAMSFLINFLFNDGIKMKTFSQICNAFDHVKYALLIDVCL